MKAKWNLTGDLGILILIMIEIGIDEIHLGYMMCVDRFCGVLKGFES